MADIFISYSSKDREKAQKLAEELTTLGYSLWLDVCDIDPATRWSTEIAEAINACHILMLLLSRASLASENVLKEVSLAAEKKKHILPIVLEQTTLNPDFEYHLAGLQHTAIENLEAIRRSLDHFIAAYKTQQTTATPKNGTPDAQKRLVVLPFEDQSPSNDNEWFSDGLTDELISNLSKLSQLAVVDRITTRQYKRAKLTLRQIAAELNIRYLLSGTVRKSAERIQITVTLIDSQTGKTLWEQKHRGVMNDIFSIQEEVAIKVAESLKLILTPEQRSDVQERRTENAEAYELGLRGNSHVSRNTKQDFLYAIKLYEDAIKLDPRFAWAYANLANTYISLYITYDRATPWLDKAEAAIHKALELNPSDAASHYSLAILLMRFGKGDEAIVEAKKAIALAPNNPIAHFQLGFIYDGLHDYQKAVEAYERALEIAPGDIDTLYNLILDYDLLQDIERRTSTAERALPYFERYNLRNPDDQNKLQKHASLLYFVGRKEECFQQLEAVLAMPVVDARTYFNCACRFAVDGRVDRAFELLIKALEAGYIDNEQIASDPDLANLRTTPQWLWLMGEFERRRHLQTFKNAAVS